MDLSLIHDQDAALSIPFKFSSIRQNDRWLRLHPPIGDHRPDLPSLDRTVTASRGHGSLSGRPPLHLDRRRSNCHSGRGRRVRLMLHFYGLGLNSLPQYGRHTIRVPAAASHFTRSWIPGARPSPVPDTCFELFGSLQWHAGALACTVRVSMGL